MKSDSLPHKQDETPCHILYFNRGTLPQLRVTQVTYEVPQPYRHTQEDQQC
jgi:hypothetical protein